MSRLSAVETLVLVGGIQINTRIYQGIYPLEDDYAMHKWRRILLFVS